VKLNLYLFAMYSLLTAAWYGITGKFSDGTGTVLSEILFNAAIFSLMFTLGLLLWYRRTKIRIPVQDLSMKALEQQLEQIGYQRVAGISNESLQVYKPVPPKAPALAGKVFLQKSANFYHLEGPAKKVRELESLLV
jgi:hypothetical protein